MYILFLFRSFYFRSFRHLLSGTRSCGLDVQQTSGFGVTAGCLMYTERAEMAAVSRGTSYATTKQRSQCTTSVDIHYVL